MEDNEQENQSTFPSRDTRFSSTNQPSGRGRKPGRSFKTILKELLDLPVAEKIKSLQDLKDILPEKDLEKLTNGEALMIRLLGKALANPESKAMERLMNRVEGMPTFTMINENSEQPLFPDDEEEKK